MRTVFATLAVGVLFAAGPALAGPNAGHPNLQAAAKHLNMASDKLWAAKNANEFDMDGHAAKANDLIAQAAAEIQEAINAANANKK